MNIKQKTDQTIMTITSNTKITTTIVGTMTKKAMEIATVTTVDTKLKTGHY